MIANNRRINAEMMGPAGEHDHVWGPVEHAFMTGNPHRKCTVEGCRHITLDLHDDDFDPDRDLYAFVTTQGTAMAESALCTACIGDKASEELALPGNDWDGGIRVNCTDNDELECQSCGWPNH